MILDFCGILFLFFAMFYFCFLWCFVLVFFAMFYFCFLWCFVLVFCGSKRNHCFWMTVGMTPHEHSGRGTPNSAAHSTENLLLRER